MTYKFTKLLMYLGSIFFLFEAVIHFFGLKILEHDKYLFQLMTDILLYLL